MCDWNIVLFAISNVFRVGISRNILGGKNSANHGFIHFSKIFLRISHDSNCKRDQKVR